MRRGFAHRRILHRSLVPAQCCLRIYFGGIEFDVEARSRRQRKMGAIRHRWMLLEMVVVPHLVDEILAEREGHWRLAGDDMHSSMDTVSVRNHRHVMQRGNCANLDQLRYSSAPLRLRLHDRECVGLEIARHLPASVEVLARGHRDCGTLAKIDEALDLFRMRY